MEASIRAKNNAIRVEKEQVGIAIRSDQSINVRDGGACHAGQNILYLGYIIEPGQTIRRNRELLETVIQIHTTLMMQLVHPGVTVELTGRVLSGIIWAKVKDWI